VFGRLFRIFNAGPQVPYGGNFRFHYRPLTQPSVGVANGGWDNEYHDLIVCVGMELVATDNTVLEVVDLLGSGTFGIVYKCINVATHQLFALKILKTDEAYRRQADAEERTLHLIAEAKAESSHEGSNYIVSTLPVFEFQHHKCVPMELLDLNLYEVIRFNNHKGLSINSVRVMANQLLRALDFLHKNNIVHCDLKPENILIDPGETARVKLVDFGTAATFDELAECPLSYIQSRYYRAPEVLIGAPYDAKIDSWSLGCVLAEVFLGLPLLPGLNDWHQVARVDEMLGPFPQRLLLEGEDTGRFFKVNDDGDYVRMTQEEFTTMWDEEPKQWRSYFKYALLEDIITHYHMPRNQAEHVVMLERQMMCDFLRGLLQVDPQHRWPVEIALDHPFLAPTLPHGPFVVGDFHADFMDIYVHGES
jgi:dual specificity protein kinase YAK1